MVVCILVYQRFQNLTLKWKVAHARNKVELEQPIDPPTPHKNQQVSVSTQKLHKSLSLRERERKKNVNVLCVTVSPLKGRTYQAHLKTVVTFQPWTAGPPRVQPFEWRMALARK